MLNDSEMTLTCQQCGKNFVFNSSEQEFFKLKGFVLPQHCKACRVDRRGQTPQLCSTCGIEIPKGKPVYCSTCLAAVQLGYELEVRKMQIELKESKARLSSLEIEKAQQINELNTQLNTLECEKLQLVNEAESRMKTVTSEQAKRLNEAETKLKEAESERARLIELLQQKELAIAGLEQQHKDTNCELEKSLKYRAAIEWLEPTLGNLKERLEALERIQNGLGNSILQLVQRAEKAPENNHLL